MCYTVVLLSSYVSRRWLCRVVSKDHHVAYRGCVGNGSAVLFYRKNINLTVFFSLKFFYQSLGQVHFPYGCAMLHYDPCTCFSTCFLYCCIFCCITVRHPHCVLFLQQLLHLRRLHMNFLLLVMYSFNTPENKRT